MRAESPLLGFVLACCASIAFPAEKDAQFRGGFSFTSTKKDGRVEWRVDGGSASFVNPTIVDIDDVRAMYYADDGTTAVATSKRARLDKETRRVTTDEFVTIVTETSFTTAKGMDWDQANRKATLKRDVRVVYKAPPGKKGLID